MDQTVIDKALSFNLVNVTERYARKHDIPMQLAKEHEQETKKYLILCGATNKEYGMRGPVDEYWHEFILFTLPYHRFCNLVSGAYIHHAPNLTERPKFKYSISSQETEQPTPEGGPAAEPTGTVVERYLDFLKDYERIFGASPSPHLWPRPSRTEDQYSAVLHCSGACDNGCGRCGCRCLA